MLNVSFDLTQPPRPWLTYLSWFIYVGYWYSFCGDLLTSSFKPLGKFQLYIQRKLIQLVSIHLMYVLCYDTCSYVIQSHRGYCYSHNFKKELHAQFNSYLDSSSLSKFLCTISFLFLGILLIFYLAPLKVPSNKT